MFERKLSVRLEGDKDAAVGYIRNAKVFFERIHSVREKMGVNTFAGQMRVDDYTYIYALTSGPVSTVQIVTTPKPQPAAPIAIPGTKYPWLGGVVFNGYLQSVIDPNTGTTKKVLATFAPTARTQTDLKLAAGKQLTPLLNVTPHFFDLKNNKGATEFSQYTKLKPTSYTGAMKWVVQAVMSYGRMAISMASGVDGTAGYIRDVKKNGFQVLYDYGFSRTHGIAFGSDGEPWLVEISITRGVIAMPLPRLSYTKQKATAQNAWAWLFYEKAQREGREEVLAFLDKFKGMPTGEAFFYMDIAEGIKEGSILQLLKPEDLADFYKCSSYSSAMGWAFNVSGTEAHNTAYYWDVPPRPEIAYGVHYRILFHFGDIVKGKRKYGDPIATASATVNKVEEGPLVQPGIPPLHIKFYEPLLPGLQSVDVRPALQKDRNYQPDARTPMHVFFVGDELKIVWFNHDGNYEWWQEVDSDAVGCLYGGAWHTTIENGSNRVPTQFSTNDFDERTTVPESRTDIQIRSNDLGYHKWWTDRLDAWPLGYIYRAKIFERVTTTKYGGSIFHHNACMIPQGMREAVYIAHHEGWVGKHVDVSTVYDSLLDPNYGQSWFWPGFYPGPLGMSAVCGGRHPDRQAVSWNDYAEWNECSEYADNGPWIGECESVQSWGSEWPNLPGNFSTSKTEDDHTVKAMLYMATEYPEVNLVPTVTWESFESDWMRASPDPETGDIQNIIIEANTWGADSTLYQKNFNENFTVTGTTVAPLAAGEDVTFVGVVN